MTLKGQLWKLLVRHKSVSFITVEDVRVGVVLRTLQLSIMAYACYMLFQKKEYMRVEVPSGYSNSWADGWVIPEESPEYCNNAAFDFVYSDSWRYENNQCRDMLVGEAVKKLPGGGLYIQTYVQETFGRSSGCNFSGTSCAERETTSNNIFVTGVDILSFGIDHTSHTTFRSDKDVATDLVDKDGNVLRSFEAGKPLTMSLDEILMAVGIASLDDKNEDAYVSTSSGYASFRLSGVLIIMHFEYSNLHDMEGKEVRAKLKLTDARTGYAGSGGDNDMLSRTLNDDGTFEIVSRDIYSYGIKIQVLFGGTVGEPDVYTTVNALVTYSVLLTFAGLCADIVAENFSGEISEAFKAKKREPINVTKSPSNGSRASPGSPIPTSKIAPVGTAAAVQQQ